MSRFAHVAAVIGGLLIATACGDSNEPNDGGGGGGGPLKVRLLEHGATSVYEQDNFAVAACAITFSGKSDKAISWRHLRFIFYADSQMTVPFDTAVAGSADLGSSWSGDFGGVEEPYSSWSLSATIPFAVRAEFFYLSGGVQSSTEPIDVTCMVPTPPNAGPPALSNVRLSEDGDGLLSTNEPVHFGFRLDAPAGSWQGYIEVWGAGACDTVLAFARPPETAVQYERDIRLPSGCAGIDTVRAGVTYFDVLGRPVSETTQLPVFTPDTIAPALSTNLPKVGGEFFAGDSLRFWVEGSENRDLAYLVWEMGPSLTRDSFVVGGRGLAIQERAIAVRPEWIGVPNLRFRFFLRDKAGLTSNVIESVADTIHVFPTTTVPMLSRTKAGDVRNVLFDAKRGRIYLAEGNFSRIAVISASTLADITTYPVPQAIWGFDLTPSGDSLILVVPITHKIGIIDLTVAQPHLDTFDYGAPGLTYGYGLTVHMLNNGKAYVSDGAVAEVDLATHATRVLSASDKAFIARSGDQTRALSTTGTTMHLFRAATLDFGPDRAEPWANSRMDQTGNRVAVGLKIFDGNLNPLGMVRAPYTYNLANTPQIALSPNGQSIFYPSYPRSVLRGSTVTMTSVEKYNLPANYQSTGIKLYPSPDGTRLLVVEDSFGTETRMVMLTLP